MFVLRAAKLLAVQSKRHLMCRVGLRKRLSIDHSSIFNLAVEVSTVCYYEIALLKSAFELDTHPLRHRLYFFAWVTASRPCQSILCDGHREDQDISSRARPHSCKCLPCRSEIAKGTRRARREVCNSYNVDDKSPGSIPEVVAIVSDHVCCDYPVVQFIAEEERRLIHKFQTIYLCLWLTSA
jgi:hypothetical protein